MPIDHTIVRHIADLARIDLVEDDEKKYRNELSSILKFVEALTELDTENISPFTCGGDQKNSMRADAEVDGTLEGKAEDLRNAIPEKKENYLKVKAVFG